ncbi:hypothetical protein E0H73_28660 [Kribbella pittospori]|uniref:Uncharacterized protein n=1 Tax=Kribbella pittospori TaxID=722689 RepID=A0A4R0KFF2_9ACTN|nr:hypothetical protein E0H73_28660 [Kribbella pittospori]
MLWFSGNGRLTPGWDAVEKEIHAALADSDVLAAAEIESVERVGENRYVVTPWEGAPFDLIVRAARVDGGHPGEFVVRADGKGPATVTVSDRAKGPVVARTMANLLHQLANAGRAGPDALRPGTQPRVDTRLSREDGGRLAEARLLRQQGETTAAYSAIRRQNIQNEVRALMEHLGVAQGQTDARWRRTVAGSDRALLNHLTRGWTAGDSRARTRVYVAKELVLVGVPATATSVGMAVTDNLATALTLGVPAVAVAVLSGIAQRWLDGHKNAANSETQGDRLKAVTKRNPGILGQLESDPYGLAGNPVEDLDPSTLRTSNWRYRLRHVAPAVVGVGLATVLTGGVPIASALYFGASALIKPLTEKFVDGRKSELKILRREELLRQFATDPARYQNELVALLAQLSDRLTEATEALARTQADPGSLGYPTIVAAELAGRGADAARLAVPRAANPNETDPTALARQLDNFGEVLIVGLLNNLFAGLATAGVTAVVERQSDQAADASYSYNLELADSAESRALFDAVQEQVTKLVQLVELAEQLGAQDPADARLLDRILERFRQTPPPTMPGTALPTPGPGPDPANDQDTALPFWVQSLYTIPPLVTLGVVNLSDAVLGMDPGWLTASVIGATATLLTAPIARWVANRQDARHTRHSADADNKRAIDQGQLADKVGVLLFLGNLREQEVQARINALQPGAGPLQSRAHDLYRAAELFFRVRPTGADFTDRVRAAVRAARLTINPQRGESFHERQDRHLALGRIEQYADRVDEVRRDDPEAKAVLRAARADLVAALKTHAAKVTDGRGELPDLTTVDPATGERVTGDPLTRARAAADEAWRRMLGEPDTTPYRTKRVIALARARAALDTLSQELATGDRARVKLAINDLTRTANAFKALQREAGVAGDVTILTDELSRQVKDFLQPPDGTAAGLGEFVANGPIQDHALLTDRIVRALADRGLLRPAGVSAIEPIGDGTTVEVTTRDGERIVLRFGTGPVTDGHPAEYRLTGDTEYALVRVSERLAPDDVARAVVHEIRELARLSAGEHTAAAHDQGRVGELLYLDEELQVSEHFEGPDPVRRRLYQQKMQELYDDLRLSDAERRSQLDPAMPDVVQRNDLGTAAALSPYRGPVRLSEDRWTVHVVPRHGHGSPAAGTKFHRDFDQSRESLEALAREVVDRAPIPVGTDQLTGNHRHEYDFGPGRVIGASGTGKVVIWVDPAGNVRSIYPEDATR